MGPTSEDSTVKPTENSNPFTGGSNGRVQQLEAKVAELQMQVAKQERDIAYKEEELRNIRNIAREVAE